jgi:hypothetical protein
MMRPRSLLTLFALLCCLAALGGCRFDEPIDASIIFDHEPGPDVTDDTIPFLFSGWETEPARDKTKAFLLWPFMRYERDGRTSQFWLFAAPVYRDRIDHRGFHDVDLIAGPVFYGHSADEGTYLTVFPLGGTLRGLLGKRYALGILFPLFLYTEDDIDPNFHSTHVLFPFINWWSGGGRSGGRIFPFYAHYERRDVGGRLAFKRTWILWPFWQTLDNNLNAPSGAQHMWFLFPFFGKSDGPETHSWTVLFPLFKYFENRGAGLGGPLWEVRAPFPFVHILRGRDRQITDIWPFYGTKEREIPFFTGPGHEAYYRRFILWPIWHEEDHVVGDVIEARWWALPLLWSYKTENAVEHWSKREFKVWPFFRYKRWQDGRVAVNIISPLWFQDPEGAFERIWGPLTRVYHEWRDDDGSYRLNLLWGLFGRRVYDAPEKVQVSRTSLLFGLIQYERRDEKKMLRFFFLPTGPEWGPGAEKPREGYWEGGVGGQRTPG